MTSWDEPAFWGERWADIYDGDDELDATSAVDSLAPLAGGGRALELAIGTGRVALPLAARGVRVRVSRARRRSSSACAPNPVATCPASGVCSLNGGA